MRDALKERIYSIARRHGFNVEKLYTYPDGWRITINRDGPGTPSRTLAFHELGELDHRLKETP